MAFGSAPVNLPCRVASVSFLKSLSPLECDQELPASPLLSLTTEVQFMATTGTQVVVPVAVMSAFLFSLVPS